MYIKSDLLLINLYILMLNSSKKSDNFIDLSLKKKIKK